MEAIAGVFTMLGLALVGATILAEIGIFLRAVTVFNAVPGNALGAASKGGSLQEIKIKT